MNNVTEFLNGEEMWVLIDRGNGEFTSMPKKEYDRRQAQQVEHLTGPLTAEPVGDVVQ